LRLELRRLSDLEEEILEELIRKKTSAFWGTSGTRAENRRFRCCLQ
jgi:hypothetical protein